MISWPAYFRVLNELKSAVVSKRQSWLYNACYMYSQKQMVGNAASDVEEEREDPRARTVASTSYAT